MLYTVQEVAKMLRVNPQTLYRGVRDGKVPHIKVCGSIRFDKAAIERWLSESSKQTVTMADPPIMHNGAEVKSS